MYMYMYYNIISFQPILDICLYIYELTDAIGGQGPLTMLGYLAVSGFVLTR